MNTDGTGRAVWLVRGALLVWITLNLIGTWSLLSRSDPYGDSDSAYYFERGREIARGRWAMESVIISHLAQYPTVEHPSFDHWQPLVAVISGSLGWLVRDSHGGARLAVFLFGSLLLPGLVYRFVLAGSGSSALALTTAAIYLSIARIDDYRLVVDTVSFAGTFLIAGCLAGGLAVSRSKRPRATLCVAAGTAFALAAMTRGDGLAVGVVLGGLVVALAAPGARVRLLTLIAGAFLITYSPLLVKNLVQFGAPVPPGIARVPWLTHYCDWYSFRKGSITTLPAFADWLAVRKLAVHLAIRAFLQSPLILVSIACSGIALLAMLRDRAARPVWRSCRGSLLGLSLASYVCFTFAALLLAPTVTLWFHRSPLPYWPIVLCGGALAADHLTRRLPRAAWRWTAVAAAFVLVSPSLALNPLRHLGSAPRHLAPEFAGALSRIPSDAVIATNHPLPLYIYHQAGVVRVPNDGERAIADAMVHYAADYLVLFPGARGCHLDPFLDRFFNEPAVPGKLDLAGELLLHYVDGSATYRVYRTEAPSASRTTVPSTAAPSF